MKFKLSLERNIRNLFKWWKEISIPLIIIDNITFLLSRRDYTYHMEKNNWLVKPLENARKAMDLE